MKPSPADTELFYSSIVRTTLALVGSPPSPPPVITEPVPPVPVSKIVTVPPHVIGNNPTVVGNSLGTIMENNICITDKAVWEKPR